MSDFGGCFCPPLPAFYPCSVPITGMQPPSYWADCPLIGKPIEGTPFITAKTPIQQHNPDVATIATSSASASSTSSLPQWSFPLESTFTLSMLIRYHHQRGMQLGMIVDLTDGRFYEPQPLCRDNNITYINMYIPPPIDTSAPLPTSTPSPPSTTTDLSLPYGLTSHYLSAFFRLLDTFTASHPSSYLLLHDIYSFDLSLFLLALYLTTNSLSPSLAFHRCCSSRPPGIVDEAMVRYVWAEGGEEVEWDVKAVLKRADWMGEDLTNWTWSGVGDRLEKRQLIDDGKASAGEMRASEGEEKREPVRPAGTVRRKQPKKTADSAATTTTQSASPLSNSSTKSSSASSSISIASSTDPYADMLADIGLASSAAVSSSASSSKPTSSSASSSSASHKRKAPSTSSPPHTVPKFSASSPSAVPPPTPAPHTNGDSPSFPSSTAPVPVHKRHAYLIAVQQPHLQRLLSTLLHLVLVPSSHYSSFPQSSPTDIRAKLVMVVSWLDRRPVTRDVLDTMVRERSQWSLTWTPVSDECVVLIMKEGTFLLFVSSITGATSTSSASSPSSLPPLYHVPHLSFPSKSSPTTLVSNTVAVGSLLFDIDQRSPTSPPTPRLLLTDLLSSPAHHPLPSSLTRRIAALDTDIVLPRAQQRSVGGSGGSDGKASALHVRCKKYFPLSKLASVLSMPLPHETEGVEVWREVGDNRRGGRVWVWKKPGSSVTEAELLTALR